MMNLQRRRRGFSLIELTIVIAIILIIITIALPRLSRARMFSQETAAIGAIRAIHTMQVQYYSQYGRYGASPTGKGPPTTGTPRPAGAGTRRPDRWHPGCRHQERAQIHHDRKCVGLCDQRGSGVVRQ